MIRNTIYFHLNKLFNNSNGIYSRRIFDFLMDEKHSLEKCLTTVAEDDGVAGEKSMNEFNIKYTRIKPQEIIRGIWDNLTTEPFIEIIKNGYEVMIPLNLYMLENIDSIYETIESIISKTTLILDTHSIFNNTYYKIKTLENEIIMFIVYGNTHVGNCVYKRRNENNLLQLYILTKHPPSRHQYDLINNLHYKLYNLTTISPSLTTPYNLNKFEYERIIFNESTASVNHKRYDKNDVYKQVIKSRTKHVILYQNIGDSFTIEEIIYWIKRKRIPDAFFSTSLITEFTLNKDATILFILGGKRMIKFTATKFNIHDFNFSTIPSLVLIPTEQIMKITKEIYFIQTFNTIILTSHSILMSEELVHTPSRKIFTINSDIPAQIFKMKPTKKTTFYTSREEIHLEEARFDSNVKLYYFTSVGPRREFDLNNFLHTFLNEILFNKKNKSLLTTLFKLYTFIQTIPANTHNFEEIIL